MKNFLLIASIIFSVLANAQAPAIQWAKCYGGGGCEDVALVKQTTDGGYIMAGESNSINGDVTNNHGDWDYWIVKVDSIGTIQWQKSLGGSGIDQAQSIQQTTDGGYIVAGYTNSSNGNVVIHHSLFDYWIVKLSNSGALQWTKTLGSNGNDKAYSIQQTTDGGYIVAGQSDSANGDVLSNHGGFDYWIVKLDTIGQIQWQKSFGGSLEDDATYVQQTVDGGYIVGGQSASSNGDVTGNHGVLDCWIVKLNNVGTLEWQKSFGGTNNDYIHSIQQTTDGGYIFAGLTASNNGDVTNNYGSFDYWVVKLNNIGTIQWQKSLGGSGNDNAFSVQQTTDGGYIVAGVAYSSDGDVTGFHGGADDWIVKLNNSGTIEWKKNLGGSSDDFAHSIQQTADGGYIIAGYAFSNDGDITGNHGSCDVWVVKLGLGSLPLKLLSFTAQMQPIPNPSKEGNVLLNWQTTNEINVSHFNIQRSSNGNEFITIDKVNSSYCNYNFTDYKLPATNNNSTIYYRLEIIDKDGSRTYSEVKQVVISKEQVAINIFPNPAKDAVTINSKGVKHLTITDCFGRIVYNAEINRTSYILNLKSFANGIYIFSFDNGERVKVVKE